MIKKYTPLIISLAVLYGIVAVLIAMTLDKNNGVLTYPLDDTFIHMAISKNFAEYGVWGITKYEFSSTTSSPLYTLILAAVYFLIGPNTLIPLILNVIFSALLMILVDHLLRDQKIRPFPRTIILLAILFFTPLPILVITGMEHILHIFFTLWFVYLAAEILVTNRYSTGDEVKLVLLGIFLSVSRYEGLFTVFAVCCLLFLRKRFLFSIGLGILSILPIIIYGIISVKSGSYWLPNSVLLKGHEVKLLSMAGIENLYSKPLQTFSQASWLFTLTLIVAGFYTLRLFILKLKLWNLGQILIIVFFVTLLFHMEFAQVGWVYRYEAYLMAFGIFIIGTLWKETIPGLYSTFKGYEIRIVALIFLILCIPVFGRGISALKFGPKASNNIYLQQYQMGRFLREYYNEQAIAANDIGAINFIADLKTFDIVGLGSIETAKAKREGRFTGELVQNLARQKGVRIALVYDRELKNSPTNWTKVGEWKIENNVVGASDIVAFYAVDPKEAETLKRNLESFRSELPKGVTMKIL